MNNAAGDERQVIRYFLGQLPERESAEMERRNSTDPAHAQFFQAVEEELIDDYLQGDLSAEDADRFKAHYLVSPERRQKVEFARALLKSFKVSRSSAVKWSGFGVAALVLILAAVVVVVTVRQRPAPLTSFTLTSGVLRSLGPQMTLTIPKGTLLVELHLLPERDNQSNQAGLRTVGSEEEIWRQKVTPSPDGRVDVFLPTAVLTTGDYILSLQSNAEVTASFSFRVAKQ